MNLTKKLLSILLAFVMVVSLLPMSVFAADGDNSTVVIACSDFQAPNGDADGQKTVRSILSKMQSDGITSADGFICCGDYYYNYSYDASTLSGHLSALKSTVEAAYDSDLDEVFVQGNHDQVRTGTGGLSSSGANDTDDYGVFVINEDDYMWASDASRSSTSYSGKTAQQIVQQTANSLKAYLDAKEAADYSKPIFVVSHLPLHYSMRTKNDGDGMYANYIFDVLNEAGENGLNIIFLHGHDHSNGWDDYLGGSCIYLAKGQQINIAQASKTNFNTETLNFTYMNAGYTGYYENHNGADATLSMTAFKITDDQVEVTRYSASDIHNLKCEGKRNSYKSESGYSPNTDVVTSSQYISLGNGGTTPIQMTDLEDSASGILVSAKGTGLTVTKASTAATYDNIVKYAAYDIQVADFVSGSTATVSIPVPAGYNANRVKVYYRDGNSLTDMQATVENGYAVFTTKQLGTFMVAEGIAQRTYTRITDASQLASGQQYLLIYNSAANTDTSKGTDSFVSPTVVTKSNSSGSRTGFDLVSTTVAGSAAITGTDYTAYEWTLTGSASGWKLSAADGKQVKLTATASAGINATLETSGDAFTVSGSADNFTFTSGSNALNYNSRGLINGYTKDTNPAEFYIYQLTDDGSVAEPAAQEFTHASGIRVLAQGTGVTVDEASTEETYANIAKYVAYDIKVTDFVADSEATVWIPIPEGYNADRIQVFYRDNNGNLTDMQATVEGSYAKFTTTHFTEYLLAEDGTPIIPTEAWTEIPGSSTYTYTRDDNGVDSGAKYLIVAPNDRYALINNNGSVDRSSQVTINNNNTITLDTDTYDWTITNETTYNYSSQSVSCSGSSYTLSNPGNYYYKVSDGVYKQVTSAKCTRSGGMGNRSYSWTIQYEGGGSAKLTTQSITLYTRTAETSYTIQKDGRYLSIPSTNLSVGTSSALWAIANGTTSGQYKLTNNGRNIRYNSGFTTSTSNYYVRLFKLTNTTTTPSTYVAMSGPDAYTITLNQYASDAAVKDYLKQNIKVWEASSNTGTGMHEVNYDITGTVRPGTVGNYDLNVSYNGKTWPITVTVKARTVTGISVAPNNGEVYVNAAGTAKTGSKLTITYDNGDVETVDVTLSMLRGSGLDTTTVGEYTNLTVTYGGKSVSGYTLNVLSRAGNDYPEYPNEGSVRVNKVGEGIDFQSTGVAKIELSATGVPMTKGADVVIMLDTSSSMNDAVDGTTRIAVLRQSLSNMLAKFNEVDATTGAAPDVRIAVADFNGYSSSEAYALASADHLRNGSIRTNIPDKSQVYTGQNTLDINAFVPATTYNTATKRSTFVNGIETHSGTNYDAAFYNTYQLVDAVNKANAEAGENRDLYVIFMSDGAPFQYNGFSSQSSGTDATLWNNWLQGTANNAASGSNSHFYNSDHNKHWWAEAIKGDPDQMYTVIDKTKNTTGTEADVPGKYMTKVNGLGAKMYSIGFCLAVDQDITVASMENVLRKIATDESYYHKADTAADLDAAFSQIATNIKKAGKDAVFTDVMGANYDLRLANYNTKADGSGTSMPTSITVSTYELYKKSEVNGTTVTDDMVGTRKSSTPSVIQETVTFNAAGTEAYSDKLGGSGNNILTDNKINAKLFTYDLATETFKWNLGDITEDEQVLSYYVYLTGSMEGERPAGSYPTNESAVLNYTNWLDHEAHKDTVSPVLPWKDANVSYAFYLVDEHGNPVVNRTTGETGSFTNRVAMSTPYVYKTLNLNSSADLRDMQVIANQVLPEGYTLHNPNASYTVTVISDGSGSNWVVSDTTGTTYVTDYKGNEYTNQSHATADVDYTHTTVWFAVRYEIKAVPDVVVIDYGLPVDINVLANDMFGENGTLRAVGMAGNKPDGKTNDLDSHFATELTATYGTAKVSGDKVRYTPANMQMSAPDKLAYAVKYQNSTAPETSGYYYSDVTVIPATIIYYEDSFVSFADDAKGTAASGKWSQVGETMPGVQAEDRPGLGNLKGTDANNLYGFDQAYENCTAFSLGSAKKVTVSKANNPNTKYSGEAGHNWPTAEFTFTGTGFDLISVTSKMTGMIKVQVYSGDTLYKSWAVDTFYGYTFVQDSANPYIKYTWSYGTDGKWHSIEGLPVPTAGENQPVPANPSTGATFVTYEKNGSWQVTPNADNALYQIPVIKGSGFDYGTYRVVITPTFSSTFDNAGRNEYDFYLDAVRIYDPAKGNTDAEAAYLKDKEAYPRFIELRNNLLGAGSFGTVDTASGVVFIDGFGATGSISDYGTYGPNNEVYLNPGQAIAFTLSKANADVDTVQIGVKALSGATAVNVYAINGASKKIATNTATDLYYDITDVAAFDQSGSTKTIVIVNTDTVNPVSITNIKTTYKAAPAAPVALRMSASAAKMAVQSVNAMYLSSLPVAEVEEVVEPQVFAPDKCTVSLSKTNAKVGDSITVTVKTSADVASVTVNGNNAKAGKTDRRTGDKTWTYTVKATEAGQLTVSVVAYDKAGLASEAIDNVITVNAKGTNIIGTVTNRILGWFR